MQSVISFSRTNIFTQGKPGIFTLIGISVHIEPSGFFPGSEHHPCPWREHSVCSSQYVRLLMNKYRDSVHAARNPYRYAYITAEGKKTCRFHGAQYLHCLNDSLNEGDCIGEVIFCVPRETRGIHGIKRYSHRRNRAVFKRFNVPRRIKCVSAPGDGDSPISPSPKFLR